MYDVWASGSWRKPRRMDIWAMLILSLARQRNSFFSTLWKKSFLSFFAEKFPFVRKKKNTFASRLVKSSCFAIIM